MKTIYIKYLKYILFFLLISAAYSEVAAQATISGFVRGVGGDTLSGAIIKVKGLEIGTAADESGAFVLQVPALPVTIITEYVGYTPQEVVVSGPEQSVEVILAVISDGPEVVVTAIGLKNTKRSINYSATEVKGEELTQSKETNLTTALSGKVAGVQIQNSGGSPGGGSTVRIRGNNSVLGNNSPLFVIDGIPVDNSVQDLLPNVTNSVSTATVGNRLIDINPEDIESMTVLKGPAASSLYGIRAANGVIVITTKRGTDLTDKPLQISANASWQVDEINRRMQPRQHKYSNGYNGQYLVPGQPTSDENWGALLDTLTYSDVPSQFDKNGLIVGKSDPRSNGVPVNRYDNEGNFFVKGYTKTYNLGVYGRKDKVGYYIGGGALNQSGIIPTTDFYRRTLRANIDFAATDKFKVTVGANYINSGSNNAALMGGYGTNAVRALRNTPDNFDITNGYDDPWNHKDAYQLEPTAAYPWGASRSYAGGRGWDNPYWSLNRNPQKLDVNRLIGFNQFDYSILPWLKATWRYGIDTYRDYRHSGFANGSNGVGKGIVNIINFQRRDVNSDLILSANRDITDDINLSVNLGNTYYQNYRYQTTTRGDNLIIPDLYTLSNASNISAYDQTLRKKLVALYASASIGYKKWLFLNLTANNEWSSALPVKNNRMFYPSIGTSFVFTDAFNIDDKILSFGKVRATYAEVGNDVDPYSLETYYNTLSLTNNSLQSTIQTPFNGQPGLGLGNSSYGVTNVIGNPDLKPERISTWEAGTELRFIKRRAGLDLTVYHTTSRDQIIPVNVPSSSGYLATIQNAGEIVNKGVEIAVNTTPLLKKNFTWDANFIYYKNISKVVSLAEGLNSVSLGGTFADSRAQVGEPYGVLYGIDYKRNNEGKLVIDDNPTLADGKPNPNYGYPIVNPNPTVLADPNPKFNASLRNILTYKFLTLSFLLDYRYGFAIANAPKLQMYFNGVDADTEDRGQYKVFDGVKNSDGSANDIEAQKTQAWYRSTFNVPGYFVEKNLYFLKLRDISLSFAVPSRWTKSFGVSDASLTLTGRNWLLGTNYSGSDPELSSRNGLQNGLGSDFWTTPNTRSYGVTLNFKLL
jgi:TonB-linked SusC/RagA family outer membrane protein